MTRTTKTSLPRRNHREIYNVVRQTKFKLDLRQDNLTQMTEVDHVVELQVLKMTLESNAVCDTLDAIIATPNSGLTSDDKVAYLAPIKDAINSADNLFFLDEKLNQVVRTAEFSLTNCR